MGKIFEKKLSLISLAMKGYFLFSIPNSFKESAKYDSDIKACNKMKALFNDKDSSELSKSYLKEAAAIKGLEVKLISKYCKKLTH